MREWVMQAGHIMDGSWSTDPRQISNAAIGQKLDEWLKHLTNFLEVQERTEDERLRLGHLLKVMSHLRPGLAQWYDPVGSPQTNNDLERTI